VCQDAAAGQGGAAGEGLRSLPPVAAVILPQRSSTAELAERGGQTPTKERQRMSQSATKKTYALIKFTGLVLVVTLCLWGCARKSSDANGSRASKSDESYAQLDRDYRVMVQARDKARSEAAALKEKLDRLESEVKEREDLIAERDQARKQAAEAQEKHEQAMDQVQKRTAERDQIGRDLNLRTIERDNALSRYEKLRKDLRTLQTTLQSIAAQDGGVAPAAHGADAPAVGAILHNNQ
jgi:TolA-binding protein